MAASAISYTSLQGTRIRETDKAVYFRVESISGSPVSHFVHWFPISRTARSTTNPDVDGTDTLVVESWIVDKCCEEHGI